MKKSILFFCAIIISFSFMAFSYMNWNTLENSETCQKETKKSVCKAVPVFDNTYFNPLANQADVDLFYNVAPRFMTTVTKKDLHNARSILDILPKKATETVVSFQKSTVSILNTDNDMPFVEIVSYKNSTSSSLNDGEKMIEVGVNAILNPAQVKLLQSADYSTNIRVTSICKRKDLFSGDLYIDEIVYYITVVPSKEAQFEGGKEALIKYLKENSASKTAVVEKEYLSPGKVSFTVTKEGTIANVKLTSTSGYSSVDKSLMELISNMPEKWTPATNSKGEKVDQKLVFFFGLEGC